MIIIQTIEQTENLETSDRLMHQLYQTTRAISKNLNYLLGEYGIFSSEWTILKMIKEKGNMSQVALSSYLNIEPAAISKSLVKLEKKGFVERKVGTDKREKNIYLTATALEQYPLLIQIVAKHREQTLAALSQSQQKELIVLLKTMYANTLAK